MPFLPAEYHGQVVMMALLAYAGPTEAGERAIAPFRALATPLVDMVRPMPYPELYQFTAEGPKPTFEAARSLFLATVDRDTAEVIIDHLRASTASIAVTQLRVLGGAITRVPEDATAYAHRQQRIMVSVGAVFDRSEETDVHEAWVTSLAKAMQQGRTGVYVNFLTDEGEARVSRRLSGTDVGSPHEDQGPLRPHQPAPPQPQHPARDWLAPRPSAILGCQATIPVVLHPTMDNGPRSCDTPTSPAWRSSSTPATSPPSPTSTRSSTPPTPN
jgi:hypothetical protein